MTEQAGPPGTSVIVPRPVDPEAFRPFGTLVAMGAPAVPVNAGTALRHDVDRFPAAEARAGLALVTSVYDAEPQDLPLPLRLLERHPGSAQLIVPIGAAAHLVVVCPNGPGEEPDLGGLAAFLMREGQGVLYRPGTWHHPIVALGRRSRFLVQSWQDGGARDCEIRALDGHALCVAAAPIREG